MKPTFIQLEEALEKENSNLGDLGGVIQKKVDDCNAELMKVKKEMLTAKGMRTKTLQQKAMMLLKRRKMYDTHLGAV